MREWRNDAWHLSETVWNILWNRKFLWVYRKGIWPTISFIEGKKIETEATVIWFSHAQKWCPSSKMLFHSSSAWKLTLMALSFCSRCVDEQHVLRHVYHPQILPGRKRERASKILPRIRFQVWWDWAVRPAQQQFTRIWTLLVLVSLHQNISLCT